MPKFVPPGDLVFNTQKVADPVAFARENRAASWLYLNSNEFSSMEGGMSYDMVERAVARLAKVVSEARAARRSVPSPTTKTGSDDRSRAFAARAMRRKEPNQ
jgi:hypothetical protein